MFYRFLFMLFTLSVFCVSEAAPLRIEVTKQTRQNPTLFFAGGSGSSALDRDLKRFLGACGWFDLTGNPKIADYKLECKPAGSTVVLQLTLGGAPAGVWRIPANGQTREIAKKAVDTIIEKSFSDLKVRGFCCSKIAFCAQTSPGIRNIYLCDIDGGNIMQLTMFRSLCVEPCWSPRGKSVCYSKYGRTGIDVLETTVSKPHRTRLLSGSAGINAGAAVSPDGKRIAVIRSPDHKVDLYVIELGSRAIHRLTRDKAVEASPCWSADGRTIYYVSDESGRPRIIRHNIGTGTRRRIPTIGADAVTPDCSADGKIVYATRINGSYTIAVYDQATGKNTRIVDKPGNWESPGWAADNRQVVCKRTQGRTQELYVIDTWSGNIRKLLSLNVPVSMPGWSQCEPKL